MTSKEERYETLLPQAAALLSGESDPVARMANLAALIHTAFGFWWTGFYRVVAGRESTPERHGESATEFSGGPATGFPGVPATEFSGGPASEFSGGPASEFSGETASEFSGVLTQGSAGEHCAETLLLGPFQGPVACTRIPYGKGVCGTAWKEARTVIVPDVEQFPGHIACSSESRSEIVVPVIRSGRVTAVLDIDSRALATFNATDAHYLERLAELL